MTWKSSDEAKAAVDQTGKVTGVAEGSATITAFVDADKNGEVGENEVKAECVVTVNAAAQTVVTLENLGHDLSTSTTAVSEETETTVNGYKLVYNNGKKQGESIFLTKNAGYIYNKTVMPGAIKSIKLFTNSGASGSAKYGIAFSASPITGKVAAASYTNVKGGENGTFTCSVENALYFCISVDNSANGQVLKLVIEY